MPSPPSSPDAPVDDREAAGDLVWGIVVAGGLGRRFGAAKQFQSLGGKPVHVWSLEAMRSVANGVVLVVPPGREADPQLASVADRVVAGGETRAESVRAGLAAVPAGADIVVVHDAVRPMASGALFRKVVGAVQAGAVAAIPGVAVSDTIKRVEAGVVRCTIDRASLVRVQTPQAFVAAILRQAHAGQHEATDDSALVEALGLDVMVVPGEDDNIKITSPSDLALLDWRLASSSPVRSVP
ncbi:MAG: 2-C-methyl-D-erythritol 4-phosphate cytidylyltransferase [Acidimicrobiales bacterium]